MEKVELSRFTERYLENRMQPPEMKWFEKELEGNPWLFKELELRRKTDDFVRNFGAIDFRRKLIEAEDRHRKQAPVVRAVSSKPMVYAAILMGIILISSVLLISGLSNNPARLIGMAESDLPTLNSRAIGTESSEVITAAEDYFEGGEYEKAAVLFSSVPVNMQNIYMAGFSYMKAGDYKNAITAFTKIVEQGDNLFTEQSGWYLAVCYYYINERERARSLLEGIAASDSKYRKNARKLARKI